MKMRRLGPTDVEIPVIGQGTWNLERSRLFGGGARRRAIAALRRGVELGMTHVDTAEMYGDGEVERIVGEALRGMPVELRERVFLASKVLPENASRKGTIAACEASLGRLGVEHLDLYLLHWRGSHPLEETIEAFEELQARGLVHHWGVSNFDSHELDDVVRIAGKGRCVCNQVLYHLEERAVEHSVLPKCEEYGMTLVAYSPFVQGRFPSAHSKGGRVLAEIAKAHGATPRQVALAFLTRRPSLAAIPKSASLEHVEENASAGELELAAAEIARIEAAFPLGKPRALPTL